MILLSPASIYSYCFEDGVGTGAPRLRVGVVSSWQTTIFYIKIKNFRLYIYILNFLKWIS